MQLFRICDPTVTTMPADRLLHDPLPDEQLHVGHKVRSCASRRATRADSCESWIGSTQLFLMYAPGFFVGRAFDAGYL